MSFRRFLIGLTFLVTFGSATQTLAQAYKVTLLELPAELQAYGSQPFAINNKGQIVGSYDNGVTFDTYGFVYDNGSVQNLGMNVTPWDINDHSEIIYRRGINHYLFRNGSETVLLGPNGEVAEAYGINSSGLIAGAIRLSPPDRHAALISPALTADLGTLEGNDPSISSYASSISDMDIVVGRSETAGAGAFGDPVGKFGFVFENGVMSSLGYLDTVSGGRGLNSLATDINRAGEIVGQAQERRAFAWPHSAVIWRNGQIKSLHPTVRLTSAALAINDTGDVVGTSYQPRLLVTNAAWLWKGGNGMGVPLNLLIPSDANVYLTFAQDINDSGQIICSGLKIRNGVIARDTSFSFLLSPAKTLTLLDGNSDALKNVTVSVSKVANDPPDFTETVLGDFTSDSKGKIQFDPSDLPPGDSIKISLKVHSEPAVKHKDILATMYTVYLDNARFDEWGSVSYDEIGTESSQEIVLDHSVFAWNLVVSFEWDVDFNYLSSTEAGFRRFSNFLYDVTDGQMILDTVAIFDDKRRWSDADMRVYASNMVHPKARVDGIRKVLGARIYMPRQWFGNADLSRNGAYHSYPYNLSASRDFRTRAHEFGHYALGFRDEYKFTKGTKRCASVSIYGYMDSQYRSDNKNFNSELSIPAKYVDVACQNNKQFVLRGMSCWEYLETVYEKTYGTNGQFVEIIRPSERILPDGVNHLLGPNDQRIFSNLLNHDVGRTVQFPKYTFLPDASTWVVGVYNLTDGLPVPKASVILKKSGTGRKIRQGKTADNGLIRVLGAETVDIVKSYGRKAKLVTNGRIRSGISDSWVFGTANLGGSGISKYGNSYSTSTGADSLDIILNEIAGDYPFIVNAAFSGNELQLRMDVSKAFIQDPSAEHETDTGTSAAQYTFTAAANTYSVLINDSLGASGVFTILAVDDSLSEYFVPMSYNLSLIDSTADSSITVTGPAASVELDVDTTIDSVLFLVSSYPVIRNGLGPDARQAGDASALAITPAASLSGLERLTIHYGDSDIGDSADVAVLETSLRVHFWDSDLKKWVIIGGSVDTLFNEVTADITQAGVYAAFTTELLPNCCIGVTGNLDCDPGNIVDITDLTVFIDHLFISLDPLCCKKSGNIDGDPSGIVDITDLTVLIDHLFISLAPTAACQ